MSDPPVTTPGSDEEGSRRMNMDRGTALAAVGTGISLPARMPPAPPEVTAALAAGIKSSRFVFPQDGSVRTVEVWEPPVITDKRTGMAIWSRLEALERFTAPAEAGEVMSRILVLLSHYRQAGHSDAVEQGIADDWAEDLGSYPIWTINEAARRWRRTRKFKPQISEIVELCDHAGGEAIKERDRLRSIVAATEASRNPLAERTRVLARSMLTAVV